VVSSGKQPEVKPADGRAGDGASSPKARVVEIDSTVSRGLWLSTAIETGSR